MEYLALGAGVFGIAFLFSMFGMGGGLFYMPFFFLFFNFQEASFLSFACIFATASGAMSVHYAQKTIAWRLVLYLGGPLVCAVFLSGLAVKTAPIPFLKNILGITLMLAGVVMLGAKAQQASAPKKESGLKRYFPDKEYAFSPAVCSPLSLVIGILSGLSGVAGGVFEIPLMVQILKTEALRAVATSSAIVTFVSLSGGLGRIFFNRQDIHVSIHLWAGMALLAFLGGRLGSGISLRMEKKTFKKICGGFIFFVGAYYLWTSFRSFWQT